MLRNGTDAPTSDAIPMKDEDSDTPSSTPQVSDEDSEEEVGADGLDDEGENLDSALSDDDEEEFKSDDEDEEM